jgi:UPF0755 protein
MSEGVGKAVIKQIKVVSLAALIFCFMYVCMLFFVTDNKILITVQSGDSVSLVASRLKANKLVLSKKLFLGLVKITKSQNKFKAGVYSFSRKDGMFKILRNISRGLNNILRFTVPEGNSVKQTAEIIAKTVNINKEKFIKIAGVKNMEGYLMPETYFVIPGMNEEQLIEMMYNEFNKKIMPYMYKKAKEINVKFKDIVIMASIIEKEAVKSEEKYMVSAVFYNRLNKNIKLQSCATVLYAMGINKSKLALEDIKFDSPYNTYVHFGLPPGPICSPGLESIKAALYPADTKNLFFVSAGDSSHLFAKSFDGHKKNKQTLKKLK